MRLKKYEIRISVTKNLYDRILQEAEYRDTKMVNIAREKLAKHFFQHKRSANPLATSDTQQENSISKTIQAQLTQAEKNLFFVISKIEKRFELLEEQAQFIVTMLNQFYFDLMKFFPDIPDEFVSAAIATAHQRHREWLDMTIKALKNDR